MQLSMCEGPMDNRIGAMTPASQPDDISQLDANSTHPSPPHAAHTSSDLPNQHPGTQPNQSNAIDEPALSLVGLLRAFFEAQDVRVATYQRLHDGFRQFLSARNESAYQYAPSTTSDSVLHAISRWEWSFPKLSRYRLCNVAASYSAIPGVAKSMS